ncbi:unnamed protein product, partial [Discosporangium mesarthrocarpum]
LSSVSRRGRKIPNHTVQVVVGTLVLILSTCRAATGGECLDRAMAALQDGGLDGTSGQKQTKPFEEKTTARCREPSEGLPLSVQTPLMSKTRSLSGGPLAAQTGESGNIRRNANTPTGKDAVAEGFPVTSSSGGFAAKVTFWREPTVIGNGSSTREGAGKGNTAAGGDQRGQGVPSSSGGGVASRPRVRRRIESVGTGNTSEDLGLLMDLRCCGKIDEVQFQAGKIRLLEIANARRLAGVEGEKPTTEGSSGASSGSSSSSRGGSRPHPMTKPSMAGDVTAWDTGGSVGVPGPQGGGELSLEQTPGHPCMEDGSCSSGLGDGSV